VDIDKARRDDAAGGVDLLRRVAEVMADGGDAAVADRQIGNLVAPGLGVHHPAATDHEVELAFWHWRSSSKRGLGSVAPSQYQRRRQRKGAPRAARLSPARLPQACP